MTSKFSNLRCQVSKDNIGNKLKLELSMLDKSQQQLNFKWKRYSETSRNKNALNNQINLQNIKYKECKSTRINSNKYYTYRQSSSNNNNLNLYHSYHTQQQKINTMNQQNQNNRKNQIIDYRKFSTPQRNKFQQSIFHSKISNQTYDALEKLHQRKSRKQQSLKNLQKKVNQYAQIADNIKIIDRHSRKIAQINDPISPLEWKMMRSTTSSISPTKIKSYEVCLKDFKLILKSQGKFGQLYLAYHYKSGCLFAIKKLNKNQLKKKKLIDRFVQEIKIQMYMNSANIVKIYTIFDDYNSIFMVMEYMEGGSLYNYLKQQNNQVLQEEQAAYKFYNILQGVRQLHKNGIIHRDIKPENIVMSHGICKICDFGCSVITKGRRQTYCGTFDYMAPEMFRGQKYDYKVDIWQLGILAYEIFNGSQPFYSISQIQSHNRILEFDGNLNFEKQLSFQVRNFISKMLKKNPKERYTINQLLQHQFFTKNLFEQTFQTGQCEKNNYQ